MDPFTVSTAFDVARTLGSLASMVSAYIAVRRERREIGQESRLKQQGYRFHLLYLWLRSPGLALHRVKERVRLGGHGVPESLVGRRYIRGARNFFRLYQPLADSWTVFDNSESNGPMLVALGKGVIASNVFDEELWKRIREVADEN